MDWVKQQQQNSFVLTQRKEEAPCHFWALCLSRSAIINIGKKDLTSAGFSGLFTRRLSTRNTTGLPAVLSMAHVPWRGFWLSTVSQTSAHVQPPTIKHKEKAEFTGWEDSQSPFPSSEAELQRAVQVSPDLSLECEVKFSCQPVLIPVDSRLIEAAGCTQHSFLRNTIDINWIMKTLVTKRNRQDLRNNRRAELKHFANSVFFFSRETETKRYYACGFAWKTCWQHITQYLLDGGSNETKSANWKIT